MIDLNAIIQQVDAWLWGWPLVGFVIIVGVLLTIALGFVQFRYFIQAWRYVFSPEKSKQTENYITPFQAFMNILSASIGNGSTAGMATAVAGGGPVAAFWVFVRKSRILKNRSPLLKISSLQVATILCQRLRFRLVLLNCLSRLS